MIDELNVIYTDEKRIKQQLRSYFMEMPQITDDQIEERTDFAKKLFDFIMLFFAMVGSTQALGEIQDIDYYIAMLIRRYEDAVGDTFGEDMLMASYISQFAVQTVNNTIENVNEEYYLSEERCFVIAENEANSMYGNYEYQQAIKSGKTHKKWLTEKDNKVRKTHTVVDETTIPIRQYFNVGDSLMLFPHDTNGEAREVVNCRCHVEYLTK